MNKDQLANELKQKLKLGIKPSDLKKPKNSQIPTPPASPIITPINKSWNSWNNKKELDSEKTKEIAELQRDVEYWSQTAQNHLTNLQRATAELDQAEDLNKSLSSLNKELKEQIKELQAQPNQLSQETEQALKEANQKIREQGKTIQELKNQSKNPTKPQPEDNSFTCSSCTHDFKIELIRLAKKSGKQICRNCTLLMLKRANQLTGQRIVLKIKSPETPQAKTFTCQTCQQTHQGEPHQVHITNFQEQGISPRQLASVCSPCWQDKVILANFYCPRTSEGRDTYNPQEPQFDCECPTNQGGKL